MKKVANEPMEPGVPLLIREQGEERRCVVKRGNAKNMAIEDHLMASLG